MILEETTTLANGVTLPRLGLGTWCIPDERVAEVVVQAVKMGYRHIDTAQAYGNEAGIGEGIRACNVAREDLFITSKVAAEHKTYEAATRSIDDSLAKMGVDYLDMMLIHSPQPWQEWRGEKRYFEENAEVWRALEDAYHAGKLRAIGVSNFLEDDLAYLLDHCSVKPMVNQILLHIGHTPLDLLTVCEKAGICVEAYAPIAHGMALANEAITAMAEKYGVSVAQLCIRYVLNLGAVALPKTENPSHMKDNTAVDFTISEEDMAQMTDYGEFSHFPVFSGKEQVR